MKEIRRNQITEALSKVGKKKPNSLEELTSALTDKELRLVINSQEYFNNFGKMLDIAKFKSDIIRVNDMVISKTRRTSKLLGTPVFSFVYEKDFKEFHKGNLGPKKLLVVEEKRLLCKELTIIASRMSKKERYFCFLHATEISIYGKETAHEYSYFIHDKKTNTCYRIVSYFKDKIYISNEKIRLIKNSLPQYSIELKSRLRNMDPAWLEELKIKANS